MSRIRLCLGLGLSAAFAVGLLASLRLPAAERGAGPPPPAPSTPPGRPELALTIRPGPAALLQLSGKAFFPDGILLRLRLWRHAERAHRGRLDVSVEDEGTAFVEMIGGAFSWEQPVLTPGLYTVEAALPESLQDPAVLVLLPRAPSPRHWTLDVPRWGDELVQRLPQDLAQAESILEQIRALNRSMEQDASSPSRWKRGSTLSSAPAAMYAFMLKCAEFRHLFPAVHRNLSDALRSMAAARPHFHWHPEPLGGGFDGAYDLSAKKWILGPDGQPFSFLRMDRFLEESLGVARREFALWILKDVQRAGLREASRTAATAGPPEARAVLEALEAGRDPSVLEAGLRGRESPLLRDPEPEPPYPRDWAARQKKLKEARGILETADRLWDELGDRQAPILYRQLANEFPEVLEDLQARSRVENRSRRADE